MMKFKINDVFNLYGEGDFKVIKRTDKTITLEYSKFGIVLGKFRRKIFTQNNHEYIKFLDYYLIAQ